MVEKRQQSLVIPIIVIIVCLFAFGIPYLFLGVDDTHDDVVLAPRFTATPTPLDRVLTQQAFAILFFTATAPQVLADTPTSTEALAFIPVTGPTLTVTPTITPTVTRSPTPTNTLIAVFPTRTQSGGGAIPATATPTKPPPTNTAIVIATITSTPVVQDPPTDTPVPEPTNPPPTDPPPTDPPPTDPPPDTPDPGGTTNDDALGLNLIFLLPLAVVLLPGLLFKMMMNIPR